MNCEEIIDDAYNEIEHNEKVEDADNVVKNSQESIHG